MLILAMSRFKFILCFLSLFSLLHAQVQVGVDVFLEKGTPACLKGKRIGLITNHSAMNRDLKTTFELFQKKARECQLVAVFSPEHGYFGDAYAGERVEGRTLGSVPLYSLHGDHRRPTAEMLQGIDVLIYDIQDIGSRSYTYLSTLFYCMEEAAKYGIAFVVLDRPNPMGGTVVDGPLLEKSWRSFLGYINIPYCHGMTVGELALLFREEYRVNCDLTVVAMRGWKRGMTFDQTRLPWVPTSPQIPEPDTPFYYPTTGLIGHSSIANIGVGYTLPFKLVGAPWIEAEKFAAALNQQKLPGVFFQPYFFKPFFGKFKLEPCQGVRVVIRDPKVFLPMTTQFTMLGVIKNLYPNHLEEVLSDLKSSKSKRETFHKLTGNEEVLSLLIEEKVVIWKLRGICVKARDTFLPVRAKYLLESYN